MTVITLTAVGYVEIHPLSTQGRAFTSYVFNPQADTRLDPGDIMIVLGKPEQIDKLRKFVNP